MAKINRFYLLIAAFICSNAYDASAGVVDCGNIEYLDTAEDCYDYWTDIFHKGELTQQKHNETFGGIDDNICDGWEDTGHAEDPGALCQHLHTGNLADYCCKFTTNGEGPCKNVLLGLDTCESTDTGGDSGGGTVVEIWECSTDEDAAKRYDEYSRIITSVTENFYSGIGYAPSDFDKFELDTRYLCKKNWDGSECDNGNPDSNDGGLMPCAKCYEPDIDALVSRACDQNTNGNKEARDTCWDIYKEKIQCDAVVDPCPSGEYMDPKDGCQPCEDYMLNGKYHAEKVASDGGRQNAYQTCYVPQNVEIEDDTGFFVHVTDCYYTGSQGGRGDWCR